MGSSLITRPMPFLPLNQHRQNTEEKVIGQLYKQKYIKRTIYHSGYVPKCPFHHGCVSLAMLTGTFWGPRKCTPMFPYYNFWTVLMPVTISSDSCPQKTRKPRKGAAVIAASMHGFANCRKFKSPVMLTLTLDRVKDMSTYTVRVGLPSFPAM